ncbi:Yta7 protein [Saccharomycopsis crataegensis]|uniref:Yta7 protein n=1 Tax=Saccharomycopsis crataegensis TaxID=43959 RepID=A0AAV5QHE6_9ASCO|nr:Yta7 protein [Saccharomycopsis crataegensis]
MGSKRRRHGSGDSRSSKSASGHRLRSRSQVSYRESDFEEELSDESDSQESLSETSNDGGNDVSEDESQPSFPVKLKLPSQKKVTDNDNNKVEVDEGDHEQEEEDDDEEEEEEEEEEEIQLNNRASRRARSIPKNVEQRDGDDDEYLEDEDDQEDDDDASEGESELERMVDKENDRNFIASEDDDDIAPRRKRRLKRKRSKKRKISKSKRLKETSANESDESYKDEDDDDAHMSVDQDSLAEELEDLKSSPESSPPRKNLRERKNVNYQIPPPLDTINLEDGFGHSNGHGMGATNGFGPNSWEPPARNRVPRSSAGLNKGLFSVAGPFGGNDIVPIFGSNAPQDLGIGAGNDSSSDDDEGFVTRPYDAATGGVNKVSSNNVSSTGIVKKNKSALADADPLGVDTNIDFKAVGGLDHYIDQLKEMVALPLLYPEVYTKFGITPPRGVLFHGPPGTGKTLMARALASSCSTEERKITFFMRKGADCLSKWVGEAERQLRLLFEEAKKQQPSIIFFDEIDGLAPVRSSKQEQIHASIVSTLLALMDGMDGRGQVIVIGATNRPDAIDPALRRPGRFDREFYFALPDIEARLTILNIHTKKWNPQPSEKLIRKLATLTKGYGGSDIRALCTEAALNSIKRKFPQIYDSSKKLVINPDEIKVHEVDFMNALDKIVPSSSRSTANPSNPIPEHLEPLLRNDYNQVTARLKQLVSKKKEGFLSMEDDSDEDEEAVAQKQQLENKFGMTKHDLFKKLSSSRVFKPRLLISGKPGMGQKYLGSAALNYLEGFQVQSLDLGTLFSESGRTPEAAIIQMYLEAKRNQPSVLFIPNLEIWLQSVPESAKSTLEGLLRSTSSSERILLLGLCEVDPSDETLQSQLEIDSARFFGVGSANVYMIDSIEEKQREEFFKFLWAFLQTRPVFEELNVDDPKYKKFQEIKHYKKTEKLAIATTAPISSEQKDAEIKSQQKQQQKALKQQHKSDVRLKNLVKIKLSTIMEIFKARYKRFKKPVIPLQQLAHLFEPSILPLDAPPPQYSKDGDTILDTYTGCRFYNMELDTIEERLWNGFYSEPKQFLKDVEMIYQDAKNIGDRERSLKASELFVNAQVSIEELFTSDLIDQCKEMRRRELDRQKQYEKKVKELQDKITTATAVELTGGKNENLESDKSENIDGVNCHKMNDDEVADQDTESKHEADQADESHDGKIVSTESITQQNSTEQQSSVAESDSNGSESDSKGNADSDTPMLTNSEVTSSAVNAEDTETKASEEQEPVKRFTDEELEEYDLYLNKLEANKSREIELDSDYLAKVQRKLFEQTDGFSIEELELMNSLISEIIWQNKHEWDRNKVLKLIEKKIKHVVKVITRQRSDVD